MLAAQYSSSLIKEQALRIVFRDEWKYIGKQYFDLSNNIKQSAYNLLNTHVGVKNKNYEVMFWGRNLTKKKYIAYAYDFGAIHLGNPQTSGITMNLRF